MPTRMIRVVALGAVVSCLLAMACFQSPQTVLERLLDSRRLSAEMLVQFEKTLEAGNRAVLADTDQASATAARDVDQATQALRSDAKVLADDLAALDYQPEISLLQEFSEKLDEANTTSREILRLAALDTNVKAQKLSSGASQDAAARFAAALEPIRSGKDARTHAIASDAVAALREIQVLQTPHIAEAQDAVMDRLEVSMREEESTVRRSLAELGASAETRAASREASQAFDNFLEQHVQILELSRRNTNVKSLALSLGQERTLAAQCEERLRALQQALEQRDISGGHR